MIIDDVSDKEVFTVGIKQDVQGSTPVGFVTAVIIPVTAVSRRMVALLRQVGNEIVNLVNIRFAAFQKAKLFFLVKNPDQICQLLFGCFAMVIWAIPNF